MKNGAKRSSRRSNTLPASAGPSEFRRRARRNVVATKSNFRCSGAAHRTRHSWSKHAPPGTAEPICRAPSSRRRRRAGDVRLTATKGDYAAVGQALMMFVPRDVWVTANFKETQLEVVRPGQPVESGSTLIPTAHSKATSTASSPAAAQRSVCCRRRMRPATTSRSSSACRSRSCSTSRPTCCWGPACRWCRPSRQNERSAPIVRPRKPLGGG